MLQQTQTSRVVEPWTRFLIRFPTPRDCANEPLSSTLRLWEGLGYHRRAKALHGAARMIRDEFDGEVPRDRGALRRLPGVGDYTADAVGSFAFHERVAVLDTNVGRVLSRAVANRSLRPVEARALAHALLPRGDAAEFNQAMLDLGARFCRARPLCDTCPVASSCRWRRDGGDDPAPSSAAVSRPQSTFEGSDRQLRGRVVALLRASPRSNAALAKYFHDVDRDRLRAIVDGLVLDGLVEWQRRTLRLANS